MCVFTNFRFRGPEVPGWGLWHDVLGRVTPRRHIDSAPLSCRYFFPPLLLLYPSNSSFLPSFPFLFPFVEFTGSRSPAPVPRERDRDIRDGKRESREHVHHYEGDARYSEWERSRQYERS